MSENVAASMTASIVIDKTDLLSQILKGLSEGQRELENNKLEMYFDFSNSKNKTELEKILQQYRKELTSKDFVVQIKNQGVEETVKSLDKLLEIIKLIASGKAFGTGAGNGKGIGNSIVDEKQLDNIIELFNKIESHLTSIKKVVSDVGDGEEFSPLLKTINNINTSISQLSSNVKGIGLNMNIDFGSDKELEAKAEAKISNALQTYQNLFEHIKMSGAGGSVINTKFFDFDINQFDTPMSKLQAYIKFIKDMREEAKQAFGGQDVLYTDTDKKFWDQASSAKGQVTKIFNEIKASTDANPLENIFGKTDLSGVIEQLNTIVSKLDEISNSAKGFTEAFKDGLNVNASVEEIEELTNRVKELEDELAKIKTPTVVTPQESNISSGRKDAFPSTEATVSVEKIADGFKEVKQETEKATESAKEYGKILSQVGLVGKKYNEFGEQVPSKYSYTRQTGENQVQTITVKFEKDKESGEIVEREIIGEYITGFQALEKEIDKADKKVFDLKKNLESNKIKLGDNYDTSALDKLIEDAENDASMLYEALKKVYSEQSEYEYSIAQYDDERAKKQASYNTQLENTKKIEEARAKNASDKKDESTEQKRQKSIEQTNRLLNKQQIIIDGIEKSYSKAANNDLDKAVNSQSDLAELEKKKNLIQFLLNGLKNEDRNSSNEKEFLQVEKLIAEYKQLAKDKLKANNPSKQELGGQELDVLLANQVTQYNKLISQSEKYGDATKEITNELKAQRDLIAEQDKNGIYVARSKKADGSELTANDYYNARDNYKINKSIFSSYETDIKSASNMVKQEASNIQAEWDKNIKAIQDYMDAMTKLNNLKAKDKGTSSEANQIALQIQNVEELKQAAWDARKNLSSIQAENPDIIAWKQWVDMMELFDQASKGSAESAAKLKDVLDNIKAPSLDKYENKLASYQTKTGGYNATIARFKNGGWTSDEYLKNIQAVKDAVKKYEDLLSNIKAKGGITSEEDVQKLKEYESEIKKTISTVTNMSAAEKGYNFVSGQKELDKIHKLLNENSKMSSEAKAKIRAYYTEIESGNPSMSLDRIHGEIMKIYNAEVEAGRAGRSFFDTLKNSGFHQIAAQMAGMFGIYDVINIGKQAIEVVTELDSAFTEMRKVSDETTQSLKNYQKTTFDTANDVGTTAMQIQNSTADWQRLGYSLDEASELAKNSNIYKNVGDMDIDEATEHMISSVQAWKSEFSDAVTASEEIMNRYNKIGNEFAISSADIGEAMETSAAALKAGGNDLNESIGLVTAGNLIQQDASTTASAMKILSLRIRGAKADLDAMGESTDDLSDSTSKMREELKALTGVDIMKDENTFKSTAEIIQEMGKNWNKLTDVSKAAALEKLAGKNRASTVSGLIENYETIGKVIEAAENSENSALEENEKYLESIEGRTQKLTNQLQELASVSIKDNWIKGIVSGLTNLLDLVTKLVDKFGIIPTLAPAIAAAFSFKNVGIDTLVAY